MAVVRGLACLVLAAACSSTTAPVEPSVPDARVTPVPDARSTVHPDAPQLSPDASIAEPPDAPTVVDMFDAPTAPDAEVAPPDACAPQCAGAVCGPDFCAGSCGDCPPDLECSLDRTQCQCPFFQTLTYTFDASQVDWTVIGLITVNVQHIDLDGKESMSPGGDFLKMMHTSFTYEVYGCRPHLRMSIDYSFADFSGDCNFMNLDVVGEATITIPTIAEPMMGSACVAPQF